MDTEFEETLPKKLHKAPIRSDLMDGTLNGYQLAAQTTANYPGKGSFWGLWYCTIKGGGEVGEFMEKAGKMARDEGWEPHHHLDRMDSDLKDKLVKELGDELWYLAAKATELGVSLEEVARKNIEKLAGRQERGTLSGSGDDR